MLNRLLFTLALGYATSAALVRSEWAIMIDAGSSHSSVSMYRWGDDGDSDSLIQVDATEDFPKQAKARLTKRPGISSFATGNIDGELLESYLAALINEAKLHVPANLWSETPIFLKATAGMRLLSSTVAIDVMQRVRSVFRNRNVCPFRFEDHQASILSGEEEAVFGWITANVATARLHLQRGKIGEGSSFYGILDLGGASTQIALKPKIAPLQHQYSVMLEPAGPIQLYATSYMRFGLNEAVKRHMSNIVALEDGQHFTSLDLETATSGGKDGNSTVLAGVIRDPCRLSGKEDTEEALSDGRTVSVVGASDFSKCLEMTRALLHVDDAECFQAPCAIAGRYMPNAEDSAFVAFGGFYYIAAAIGIVDVNSKTVRKDVTLDEFATKGREFCSKDSVELDDLSKNVCFGSAYVYNLLSIGYGLATTAPGKIIVSDSIASIDLGWAFGAALYELQLRRVGTGNAVGASRYSASSSSTLHLLLVALLGAFAGAAVMAFALASHETRRRNARERFLFACRRRKDRVSRVGIREKSLGYDDEEDGDDTRPLLLHRREVDEERGAMRVTHKK